jgi:hypothetical protein
LDESITVITYENSSNEAMNESIVGRSRKTFLKKPSMASLEYNEAMNQSTVGSSRNSLKSKNSNEASIENRVINSRPLTKRF